MLLTLAVAYSGNASQPMRPVWAGDVIVITDRIRKFTVAVPT